MKLTAKEILEKLDIFFEGEVSIYAWYEFDEKDLGLGEIEEVDNYGGEGQGDTWYTVRYFKDHDVYIKTNGFYSSYNGTDFDYGFGEEVKPVEKTITVYE